MRELGKNEKRIGLYILILCNLILLPFYSSKAAPKESGIQAAFEQSEANFAEMNINAHAAIENQFIGVQKATQWCWQIAEQLELENGQLNANVEKDYTQVWITGKVKAGSTVTIQIQSQQHEKLQETHIMIDFYEDHGMLEIKGLTEQLYELLKPYGKTNITTCLIGTFEGNMEVTEREEVVKALMKALEVKEVEGYREGNIISIVGYSDKIKEWINYGGNRVNVNIAMRYNDYENKTFLWIGTPLITVGY
ncbi:YwmB family TATA-box binding protein [Geosporobacter ferrireducens]|uniref:TATA-box binding protein n=1 Tax=Geosporobacter ferrireducens TaxID=1424294 RepID=A0A1D8GGL9_9FIRM|nr:YwmB family TATA-box binding protein [Geosporobacter ferrireducens]AOT70065.1 hypothetical protein Gferi_10980 [Geosporobacter ferrireducens]MTI53387.1 hypothetical protein [Geosporobacter ferrireducens]